MDKDNMNDNSYESTDKYCLVIIENGLPVFVSMAMPKHSCETMKVAIGEGEIVPSDLGLQYKRMMTNIPDLLQNSEVRQPTGVRTALSHSASIPSRERGLKTIIDKVASS
jgi:hypothetical protein